AQARAALAAAQAAARDASAYYARLRPLGEQKLVAAADVDRARAAAASASAQVQQANAALDELLHGTREERIAQGEAAVQTAAAQARAEQTSLDKLTVVAPRAGIVDSIPYELGDQAPVGAPLAILLVGNAPHARIYVPETLRAGVKVGDSVRVFVHGREQALAGTVRMIRSEPSFTPYYALIGEDAARLSYLAEIELGKDAAQLPAGLPVRVEFGG
nr:HlyD family secretion protein [Pseudomonadota bacterium]